MKNNNKLSTISKYSNNKYPSPRDPLSNPTFY